MSPKAPAVRKLVREILRSDSDFMAFCLDHFPETHARLSNGMDRVAKVSLLLQHEKLQRIVDTLRREFPDEMRAHAVLLEDGDDEPVAEPEPRLPLPAADTLLALDGAELTRRLSSLAANDPEPIERYARQLVVAGGGGLRALAAARALLRESRERAGLPLGPIAVELRRSAGAPEASGHLIEWADISLGPETFRVSRHPITMRVAWELWPELRPTGGAADPDWPWTHLSYSEAATVAELLGGRLPTASEMDLAGWRDRRGGARLFPWGDELDVDRSNCLERRLGCVCPVHHHDGLGTSAWGLEDVAGNVWEWTATPASLPDRSVVLGGSHQHLQRASMRGQRDEYDVHLRLSYVGFRVAAPARKG